jgi:hypothetical protein
MCKRIAQTPTIPEQINKGRPVIFLFFIVLNPITVIGNRYIIPTTR